MEYVYAALLLHKLKREINEDSVKKVVAAAGVTPDEVKVKALVSALSEVDIDEVLEAAKAAPVTAAPAAPAPKEKAKEEEKKEEEAKSEEEALAGLASLFG